MEYVDWDKGQSRTSKSVLLFSQVKSGFAALHDGFDSIANFGNINGSLLGNRAARLVSGSPVIAPYNQFGITINN